MLLRIHAGTLQRRVYEDLSTHTVSGRGNRLARRGMSGAPDRSGLLVHELTRDEPHARR